MAPPSPLATPQPPPDNSPLYSSETGSFPKSTSATNSSFAQRRHAALASDAGAAGDAASPPAAAARPRPQRRGSRRPLAARCSAITWAALRRAALLAVALGGLLGCCGGVLRVRGQEVVLSPESEGCLSNKAPGPPRNLKANPKDGRVILSWEPPSDGACVSAYVVNVIDPLFRADTPAQSTSTGRLRVVVEGLTNGRNYLFQVQAYSAQLMTGGVAQINAIPSDLCSLSEAPGKPTNLRLQTGDGWARLCWDGVENDACVDQYRVSASLLSAGPDFRGSSDGKISRGGCANVTGLVSGAKYRFTVTPASGPRGEGTPASLTAEVGASAAAQNGWSCRSLDGCPPNRGGLCSTGGGCSAVARRGDCRVPALVDIDWSGKQVTQWCSSSCACELGPAQGGALMGNPRALSGLLTGAGLAGTLGAAGALGAGALTSGSSLGGLSGLGGLGGLGAATPGSGAGAGAGAGLPLAGVGSLLMAGPADAAAAGDGGSLLGLGQGRVGQFVGGMAQQMVSSGVVGEAAGKVAAHVVSTQVNTMLQGIMEEASAATTAGGPGGRRLRLSQ